MRSTSIPLWAASLLLAASCGDGAPPTPSDRVESRLVGYGALEGPAAGAAVSAKDGASDDDTVFAHSSLDEQGEFTLELGPLYGPMVLEVETAAGDRLSTWVVLAQGETQSDVQVSPVTTLALAWAQGAGDRGLDTEAAWERARELVFGHLGDVDHARVAPVDLRTVSDVAVDDGVIAGLVAHGLAEQAARLGRRAAGQGGAPVTLGGLVAAYARDLEDGLADGVDRFGAPVTVGGVRLTPDSLRLDLSMALAAFLDGPRNGSRLRSTDVRDLLVALREADGPLFPEGSLAARDQTGPALSLSWHRGGAAFTAGAPVTGLVELGVMASDPSGVAALEGRIVADPEVALAAEVWSEETRWVVDTTAFADGAYAVEVQGIDGLDFVRTATSALVVDHTAPTVMITAPAQVATPTVAVTGSWFDASGVEQVSLRVDGEVRLVLEHPRPHFEATVALGCRGGTSVTLEAQAVDAAGNVSAPAAQTVTCVGTAPTLVLLPSSVIDERAVTFEHGPDGALLGVRIPPSSPDVVLDERTVWPVRLHKLFTRLDAASSNLPIFRWRAAGEGTLTARYRTFVDGLEARPWAPLPVELGGRVDLPVSYQTFGQGLVLHSPSTVQAAEVEVTDGQGSRVVRRVSFQLEVLPPPVWVGGCAQSVTASGVRLGFSAGVDTDLVTARARWDLDLEPDSAAPTVPVRLAWGSVLLGAQIASLGEDKWWPSASYTLPPSDWCVPPIANPAGETTFHTVLEGPGQGMCRWGVYPVETHEAFVAGRDGRVSAVAALAGAFEMQRGSVPLVPDGQGRLALEAGAAYDVALRVVQPRLLLPDGSPYTWPSTVEVPAGYVTTVQATGRARYPVPTFERRGADHTQLGGATSFPFVTRAFVQRVQIERSALRATADLPILGITVPVTFDAACSASQVLEVQL